MGWCSVKAQEQLYFTRIPLFYDYSNCYFRKGEQPLNRQASNVNHIPFSVSYPVKGKGKGEVVLVL